jgi:hypothetical protein
MKKCMTEEEFERWMKGKKMYAPHPFSGGPDDQPVQKRNWKKVASARDISEYPLVAPPRYRPSATSTKKMDTFYKHARTVGYDRSKRRFCLYE